MTRNDQTGVLTPVQGSPYAAATFQTLDAQGRFLFGLGTNGIHMYQVDATTGAFAEVPHSPFASANTNQPAFIAVEPTGSTSQSSTGKEQTRGKARSTLSRSTLRISLSYLFPDHLLNWIPR